MKKKSIAKQIPTATLFFKTFAVALILFAVVFTPIVTLINNFLETSPFQNGDGDGLEDVKFEVLVDPQSPFFAEFSDSERVNFLALGLNDGLPDVIMLASFDPKSKHLDIISIPRDTYYYRPGYADDAYAQYKINAAYRGDPLNMANIVSEIFMGIPINYYVVVEYEDIEKIVDEIGGVPIYIEKDMNYVDEWAKPPLRIHLKAGQQVLNGEDSVKFLRFREDYAEGDIGRMKAQQVWLQNAFTAAIDYGILKTAQLAFDEVESNLTYKAMLSLSSKALGMSAESIEIHIMPHTLLGKPPWYVFHDSKKISELLQAIYSIESAPPEEDENQTM